VGWVGGGCRKTSCKKCLRHVWGGGGLGGGKWRMKSSPVKILTMGVVINEMKERGELPPLGPRLWCAFDGQSLILT